MKKWLIGIVALIILLLAGIYVFIPKKLIVAKTDLVRANENSVVRFFSNKNNWVKWWQNEDTNKKSLNSIDLNKMTFTASNTMQNGLEITIETIGTSIKSTMSFYTVNKDSSAIEWKCEMGANNNPFRRLMNYKQAVAIKENMNILLNKMHSFVENEANIYELKIEHEIISDTLVISQKANFPKYPTTAEVYVMINELRKYALANNAGIKGPPMMNVSITSDSLYQTMVALPLRNKVNNSSNIELKNLTSGTPMLSAVVTGGNYVAANALATLENYKADHQFTSPAIPYFVLVTDRDKEPDSTKWETKVCDLLFPWFK